MMMINAAAKPELTRAPSTTTAESAIASTTIAPAPANDITRCSYPGKKCTATRAVKPNGTLHKLCELHRRRANLNQKRLQQKRRLLRDKLFKRAHGLTGVGKATANDMLYAIDAPQSPSQQLFAAQPSSASFATRALSSPSSMDALLPRPMAFRDHHIEHLFADAQQLSGPLDFAPEFSSEDVYLLQAALFCDGGCASHLSCAAQFAWHTTL